MSPRFSGGRSAKYSPSARRPTGGNRQSPSSTTARRQQRPVAVPVVEAPRPPASSEVAIPQRVTVQSLSDALKVSPNQVIKVLMTSGVLATINQVISYNDAVTVAEELNFTIKEPSEQKPEVTTTEAIENQVSERPENLKLRPPVVTILGHVDHGKTSLLDKIRQTNVTAGEIGGITQHIGAYQVEVDGKKITFLDTPGHEAFTAMRARGAKVTDVAVLVVAADDGVQPQTLEAIDHARAAKLPIVVAINKMDRQQANPDLVKNQLAQAGLLVEEYGGDVVAVPVSATKGTGVEQLLEMILLVTEIADLKANPDKPAEGVVIEAKIDRTRGAAATLLVQSGTLNVSDTVVVGSMLGKVRAMFNDRGKRVKKAEPSAPVEIIGLSGLPTPGDHFKVFEDEKAARAWLEQNTAQAETAARGSRAMSLEEFSTQVRSTESRELNLVLKTDVQGSTEPIQSSLEKLSTDKVQIHVIHAAAGTIVEADVMLAKASGAMIIGFKTPVEPGARNTAESSGVEIRQYDVIYRIVEDIQMAMTGVLEPALVEVIDGHAEVRQLFTFGRNRVIAGCIVSDGKVTRSSQVRLLRDGKKIFEGRIDSLKRFKDDAREVQSGYECGIAIEGFSEINEGDIIEVFHQEQMSPQVA